MSTAPTRPVLMSKVRRFGRYDYERFDHISSSHALAGYGTIGKVTVNCRFLFTKAQWGVLGDQKLPGGIVYLDLDFDQPPDCRLKHATVAVTLDEENGYFLEDSDDRSSQISDGASEWPHRGARHRSVAQFTDSYGPKHINGEKRVAHVRRCGRKRMMDSDYGGPNLVGRLSLAAKTTNRRTKRLTPHIEVLGQGAGGLGQDIEKIKQKTSRWKFSGHLMRKDGSSCFNTLKWELLENGQDSQAFHNNTIHTAFALDHNGHNFVMKVEVQGKLEKFYDRVKQWKGAKFGGDKQHEQGTMTTVVAFGKEYKFSRRLDELARDLSRAMEFENQIDIPLEIPDAMPAGFGAENGRGWGNMPVHHASQLQGQLQGQLSGIGRHDRPYLQDAARPQVSEPRPMAAIEDAADNQDEMELLNIAQAAGFAPLAPTTVSPPRPRQESPDPDDTGSTIVSATLVASEQGSSEASEHKKETSPALGESSASSSKGIVIQFPTDPLLWLSQLLGLPILLAFLRYVALSISSRETSNSAGAAVEVAQVEAEKSNRKEDARGNLPAVVPTRRGDPQFIESRPSRFSRFDQLNARSMMGRYNGSSAWGMPRERMFEHYNPYASERPYQPYGAQAAPVIIHNNVYNEQSDDENASVASYQARRRHRPPPAPRPFRNYSDDAVDRELEEAKRELQRLRDREEARRRLHRFEEERR